MVEVERAGPAELPDSERYWKIEKQEGDLKSHLGELEQGTRQRNREFEAKLRSIEERTRGLEAAIFQESKDCEKSHAAMFAGLEEKLKGAVEAIEVKVEASITARFEPGLHEHVDRVESGDAKLEEFIHVTVPRILDDQNGAVTRKLQKAHETFDIENAKIIKREQKAHSRRFSAHVSQTAQSLEDEKATRLAKLSLLREDLDSVEYMDDRGDEKFQVSTMRTIKAMREDVAKLSNERAIEDSLLLDSLANSQQRLQSCILETFGATFSREGEY
ncbi:unnamed protein product [Ascophyllum nodosum]